MLANSTRILVPARIGESHVSLRAPPPVFHILGAAVWGGGGAMDACDVCGGSGACLDCASVPNGNSRVDHCGECETAAEHCAMDCKISGWRETTPVIEL